MDMDMEIAIKVAGGISALIATVFAIRKFLKWLRPIKVSPSFTMCLDGAKSDSICAEITNQSSEAIYVTECSARGTYSLWHIIKVHIKHPFIKPSLYQNIRYNGAVYSLSEDYPIKIEPGQPLKLEYQFYEHPLNAMFTPYFLIIVRLSSGYKLCSIKMQSPVRWRFIGITKPNKNV